jgi:dTDP-4-dehydrorhamnose reductase
MGREPTGGGGLNERRPPVRSVLVTGGAGLIASRLVLAAPPGVELVVTARRTPVPARVRAVADVRPVDLCDAAATAALVEELSPEVVVHAAYTQTVRRDVVDASDSVAAAAAAAGSAVVHLSSDAVFDGDHPPYAEDDPPDPVSDYGRWKAEAERLVVAAVPDACITRTSLVISVDPPDGATAALLGGLRDGPPPRLFRDEWRQPIRVEDLVAELWALLARPRAGRAGIWHLPGPERLSRLELGRRMARFCGLDPDAIVEASRADHPTPRPADLTMVGDRRTALGRPPGPVAGDVGGRGGHGYGVGDGEHHG